jgi:hypothetical protein
MANESSFFYWYRRYRVRAVDMTAFQEAMVETARGLSEGAFGAAVLNGFDAIPASGLSVSVGPGIAVGPSGYLDVINSTTLIDVSSPSGSFPSRSLIVVTANLVDENFIPSPTSPFTTVPLNQAQKAQLIFIPGTPSANPEYPTKGANDTIICGVILPPNANQIIASMLDFEIRDSIGKNSEIQQNQVRFDDRLRPFRSSSKAMGLKPSQTIGSGPVGFSYPGRLIPSKYPLMGGSFSGQDSFLDFQFGTISGGDTTSPAFTPVTPSGNNSVVALVTLGVDDTVGVAYGTEGGFAQCVASIQNQISSGAGSIPAQSGNFPLAYVIVTSFSGSVSDVQVYDARPFLGSGASATKFKQEIPSGSINGVNTVFVLSKPIADPSSLIVWIDNNPLELTDYTLNGSTINITNPALVPVAGQTVYTYYLVFGAIPNSGPGAGVSAAQFFQEVPVGATDGSNNTFILSNTPADPNSLVFWVDQDALEKTDYTLVGATLTITNPIRTPAVGQNVYAYYLYLGVIMGGGGGGGGLNPKVEQFVLNSGNIASKSLVLSQLPNSPSAVIIDVRDEPLIVYGSDYAVSGATVTWAGLGLDGVVIAGDVVRALYFY